MHQTLMIPELMARVAFFLDDKKSMAAAARTCQVLSEAALDVLWSDLESVLPLVRLLGNLVLQTTTVYHQDHWGGSSSSSFNEWEFSGSGITRKDWATYRKYSPRVKKITLSPHQTYQVNNQQYPLSAKVFAAIGLTQSRTMPLLPNLRYVVLEPTFNSIAHCFPFLDQNVLDVELTLRIADDRPLLQYVVQELCVRLPRLTVVRIETGVRAADIEDQFVEFLDDLHHLRNISLPPFYLTSRALVAISNLQRLEKISMNFEYAASQFQSNPSLQKFQDSSLSNLTKLAIASSLEPLFPFFADRSWAPLLTELEVTSPTSSPQQLRDFSMLIAQHRSNLTSLQIDMFGNSATSQAVDFQHLIPLLECNKLIKFGFRHRLPCRIYKRQLGQMLEHWPTLKEISICVDPDTSAAKTPQFSFDTLNLFAKLCPHIEKIGLFFDGGGSLKWSSNLRLLKLKELHVGWVRPANASEVGLYLASLCEVGLKFVCGGWKDSPRINTPDAGQTPVAEWDKVARRFRLLARIRERTLAEIREVEAAQSLGWRVMPTSNEVPPPLSRESDGEARLSARLGV